MNSTVPTYEEDGYTHPCPGLIYIETSFQGDGADGEDFIYRSQGCKCSIGCQVPSCECLHLSKVKSRDLVLSYLDRQYPIFECNSSCSCDKSCPNRLTQLGPIQGLRIVSMEGKGLGVVTDKEIPKGSFICEYAGEIIGEEVASNRLRQLGEKDHNYLLFLREHLYRNGEKSVQTTIIDPTATGNIGRYLNHSCDPNLQVLPIRSENLVPIAATFALKHINAGEELCYNYNDSATHLTEGNMNDTILLSSKPCLCSSSKCRNFLPSNQSLFK